MIRVVLADDHAVVRRGIRDFLEESGEIQVVAEAGTGDEALTLIRTQRPDLAVLDIQMPGRTGLEVTRTRRAEQFPVGILKPLRGNPSASQIPGEATPTPWCLVGRFHLVADRAALST